MTNKEDDFTSLFTAPVNNSFNERYSTILLPFINDRLMGVLSTMPTDANEYKPYSNVNTPERLQKQRWIQFDEMDVDGRSKHDANRRQPAHDQLQG